MDPIERSDPHTPTNSERAKLARQRLVPWCPDPPDLENDCEIRDALVDCLTDLRHLSDACGWDHGELDNIAYGHYCNETVSFRQEEDDDTQGVETMTSYHVIKTVASHPGPGLRTSVPEREVTMSCHRTQTAAAKAAKKYERAHRGYATFRVIEVDGLRAKIK